jgi:hypothetical protein
MKENIAKGGELSMKPNLLEKDAKHLAVALSALNEALSKLSGEDKDQIESVINSIQALNTKLYSGETKKDLEPAPIATPAPEATPTPEATPIALVVAPAAQDFTEVISQLQLMVKDMVATSDQTKAMLEENKAVQAAVEKMRVDIVAIADKISIRKGSGPEGGDERPTETDPIKATKAVPGFSKLHPGNKLQRVIEAAVTGKAVTR